MGMLGKILAEAILGALGDIFKDLFKTWRLEQAAQGRGRAEAERDQALAGLKSSEENAQMLADRPTFEQVLEDLRSDDKA